MSSRIGNLMNHYDLDYLNTEKSIYGYVRVSSRGQKDNTSIPKQADKIQEWCLLNGYTLKAIFRDVESGENVTNRSALVSALQGILNEDQADGLVVFCFDRLSRTVEDRARLRRQFMGAGKILMSCTEEIDLCSVNGKLFYQMTSVIAEHEKDLINQRCLDGKRRKVQSGGWGGHCPPYGWRAHNNEIMEDPEEQEVCRFILGLTQIRNIHGKKVYGHRKIAKILNQLGVPTKSQRPTVKPSKRKDRDQKRWWPNSVKRIIDRAEQGYNGYDPDGKRTNGKPTAKLYPGRDQGFDATSWDQAC